MINTPSTPCFENRERTEHGYSQYSRAVATCQSFRQHICYCFYFGTVCILLFTTIDNFNNSFSTTGTLGYGKCRTANLPVDVCSITCAFRLLNFAPFFISFVFQYTIFFHTCIDSFCRNYMCVST